MSANIDTQRTKAEAYINQELENLRREFGSINNRDLLDQSRILTSLKRKLEHLKKEKLPETSNSFKKEKQLEINNLYRNIRTQMRNLASETKSEKKELVFVPIILQEVPQRTTKKRSRSTDNTESVSSSQEDIDFTVDKLEVQRNAVVSFTEPKLFFSESQKDLFLKNSAGRYRSLKDGSEYRKGKNEQFSEVEMKNGKYYRKGTNEPLVLARRARVTPLQQGPLSPEQSIYIEIKNILTRNYDLNSMYDTDFVELVKDELYWPHTYISDLYTLFSANYVKQGIQVPQNIFATVSEDLSYDEKKKLLMGGEQNVNLDRLRRKYGIIRSYIDIYHDFLHHGKNIIEKMIVDIVKYFPESGQLLQGEKTLATMKQECYEAIFTKSGNVSQEKCQSYSVKILEEYCALRQQIDPNKSFVQSKSQGLVLSANINNPDEMEILRKKLINDHSVTQIAVESIMMAPDNLFKGLTYTDTQSGLFDAGSGVSIEKAITQGGAGKIVKGEVEKVVKFIKRGNITTSRDPKNTNKYSISPVTLPYKVSESTSQYLYGDNTFSISIQNNAIQLKEIRTNKSITTSEKISVNALASFLEIGKIRGADGTEVDALTVEGELNNKYNAIALKTWTDYIQLLDFVLADAQMKTSTAVIISDKLCEMIGLFMGDGHHLLMEGGQLYYYCYNINRRKISKEVLEPRYILYSFLAENMYIINLYIDTWVSYIRKTLYDILNLAEDPALYYAMMQVIPYVNQVLENKIKYLNILNDTLREDPSTGQRDPSKILDFLKSLPETPVEVIQQITQEKLIESTFRTKYSEFLSMIIQATEIAGAGRMTLTQFVQLYGILQQMIVNATSIANNNTGLSEECLGKHVGVLLGYIAGNRGRSLRSSDSYKDTIMLIKASYCKTFPSEDLCKSDPIYKNLDYVINGIEKYKKIRIEIETQKAREIANVTTATQTEGAIRATTEYPILPDEDAPQYRIPYKTILERYDTSCL